MTTHNGSTPGVDVSRMVDDVQSDEQSAALRAINLAREAISDAGHDVSVPGASEPGEFYVQIDGVNLAIRVEAL